jgi:microcystin-dependent protein
MGLLEDLNSGKYNLILFGIIFFFIFHQYWNKNSESMADVASLTEDKIKELIYKTYLIDVTAIKNLSDVANKLQAGGLTIPGDLTVSGKFNYLPRGTIVAYNQNTPPTGWTLCDGSNGSPDLRNRFILGWGNRGITATGGEENVTLTEAQMPSHNHAARGTTDSSGRHHHTWGFGCGGGGGWLNNGDRGRGCHHANTTDGGEHSHNLNITVDHKGGNQSHNNMPPFYVLTYIMKL